MSTQSSELLRVHLYRERSVRFHPSASSAGAQRGGLYDSRTLLHCAAAKGHAPIVAELLRRGADRGATDKRGATAVALARKAGHEAVVALLEGAAGGGEGGEGGGGGGGDSGGVGGGGGGEGGDGDGEDGDGGGDDVAGTSTSGASSRAAVLEAPPPAEAESSGDVLSER